MIDILSIKPHVVSKDLRGYTIMFYGAPKVGKTTTAARFEKNLIAATEVGYLAIPGAMVAPIQKWADMKNLIKQLGKQEAKEMYYNITIDTADLAYALCEKYICNKNGVEEIGQISYGGGYAQAQKEFDEVLRAIPAMGYGLILISHAQDKVFKDEDGNEYNKICPTLANRPRLVVDRMSDLICYARPIQDEEGNTSTRLYLRGTPRFEAGCRFKYVPDYIDFTYESLVKAISDAIDKEAAEYGNKYVTEEKANAYKEVEVLDYEAMIDEFNTLVEKLQNATGPSFATKWAPFIVSLTDKYLGKGKRISDATAAQAEQISLILSDLKEKVGLGI